MRPAEPNSEKFCFSICLCARLSLFLGDKDKTKTQQYHEKDHYPDHHCSRSGPQPSCNGNKEFRPGEVWLDNNGVAINAHGGGILYHDGRYYWFGEHKTEGEGGNRANIGVHCYSSKNLYDWRDEGIALAVDPEGSGSPIEKGCILERPKVIYNEQTGKFVMWFHLELKDRGYAAAMSGVAVSDNITGPYKFLNAGRVNAGVAAQRERADPAGCRSHIRRQGGRDPRKRPFSGA